MKNSIPMPNRNQHLLIASLVFAAVFAIGPSCQLCAQEDLEAKSLTLENPFLPADPFIRIKDVGSSSRYYQIIPDNSYLNLDTGVTSEDPAQQAPFRIAHDATPGIMTVGRRGVEIGGSTAGVAQAVLNVKSLGPDDPNSWPEANIRVQNLNHESAVRTMIEMRNPGGARFAFINTDTNKTWAFQNNASDAFLINLLGSGGNEMSIRKTGIVTMGPGGRQNFFLDAVGNLTLLGTLNQASDRNLKEGFAEIDESDLLRKIAELPISRWSYKDDNCKTMHIGPMSQDFHAAFKVGKDDKTISVTDAAGIAFAGIKALNQRCERVAIENDQLKKLVEVQQRSIEDLETRFFEMSRRTQALEAMLPN